jgi:hypothetical protein
MARIAGAALIACGSGHSGNSNLAVAEIKRGLRVGALARLTLIVGHFRRSGSDI